MPGNQFFIFVRHHFCWCVYSAWVKNLKNISISYDAKALLLTDRSNGEVFLSKREEEPELPASLAKLFVVEYAAEIAAPDAIVLPTGKQFP